MAAWKVARGEGRIELEDLLQEGRMAVLIEMKRNRPSYRDQDARAYYAARRGMIDLYRRERGRRDESARRRAQFVSLDAGLGEDEELSGHDLLAAPMPDRYELDDVDLATLRAIERLPEKLRVTVLAVGRHKRQCHVARSLRVSETLIGWRLKRARQLIGAGLWARFREERGDPRLAACARRAS